MEQEQLIHFKTLLEKEREELEDELRSVGRINPSNPADWEPTQGESVKESDANDQADNIKEYEENTAILRELEIRYNEVRDAITKIEDGTYGICEEGGEPINEKRLEANPAARTCVEHAPKES
jgi:RNA polymerase-binding transcription factor DksA